MAKKQTDSPASEALERLQESVEQLAQQVQVLTQAVDELTDELQWRNNHLRDADHSPPRPFVLHSLPADPTTKDWQVNRVQPKAASPRSPATGAADDPTLFD